MRSRNLISARAAQSQGYICLSCRLKSAKSKPAGGLRQQATQKHFSSSVSQDEIKILHNADSSQQLLQGSIATKNLYSFQHGTVLSRSSESVKENPPLVAPISNQNQIRFLSTKPANSHGLAEKRASGKRFLVQEQQAVLEERDACPSQSALRGRKGLEHEAHVVQLEQTASGVLFAHNGENGLLQPTFVRPLCDREGTALSRTSLRLIRRPLWNNSLLSHTGMVAYQSTSTHATQSQSNENGTAHSLRSPEEAASGASKPNSGVSKQRSEEKKIRESRQATSRSLTNSKDVAGPDDPSSRKFKSLSDLLTEKDLVTSKPKARAKAKAITKPKSKSNSKSKSKPKPKPKRQVENPKTTKKNDQTILAEHIETQIRELRERLHQTIQKPPPESRKSVVRRLAGSSVVRRLAPFTIPEKMPDPPPEIRKPSKSVGFIFKAEEGKARFTKIEGSSLKEAISRKTAPIHSISAADLNLLALDIDRPPVPELAYGLERVLFNPGVYQLQDPRSGVYNFEPYLQKLMPIEEFDFNALTKYVTSSKDTALQDIATKHQKRYIGSTSSMTSMLAHFHFLLSQWRPINISMLSKSFPNRNMHSFTEIQRCPSAIFLKWQDGTYAIDADKQFDGANVLSMLGKSMEKLLTLKTDDFERYRKSNPGKLTEEESQPAESYHYSTLGDFLMRSQLDAYDPRIPGTGMFDLKTRAVVSIRMDVQRYAHGTGYQIKHRTGEWESFEREYFDMIRAAFLKYSLQVRMGRMDGIFVAFHNVERIFGFQYISLPEMDAALHGHFDTTIGDQEFVLSLGLLNKVLDKATQKFPEKSLRLHFETREGVTPFMYIFAEPVSDEEMHDIQTQNASQVEEFERRVLGLTSSEDDGQTSREDAPKWEDIQANVEDAMDRDELSLSEGGEEDYELSEGQDHEGKSHSEAFDEENVERASAGDEEMEGGEDEEEEVEEGEDADEAEEAGTEEQELEEEQREEGEEEEEEAEETSEEEELQEDEEADEADAEADEEGIQEDEGSSHGEDREGLEGLETEEGGESQLQPGPKGDISSSDTEESTPASPPTGSVDDLDNFNVEADSQFLETLSTEEKTLQADTEGELLAMTLTLRNKVNGYYILRPENLKPEEDKWSVEYSLAEIPSATRAKALYEACKVRRRKRLDQEVKSSMDDAAGDDGPLSNYVKMLREMSTEGRAWRKKMDEEAKELPVRVLGRDK